jgi:hypothetical protein
MGLVEWGVLLLILAAIAAFLFFVWSWLRYGLMFLAAGWKNRSSLNPARPDGRWRLLGLSCFLGAVLLFYNFPSYIRSWLVVPILALAVLLTFVAVLSLSRAKRFEATTMPKGSQTDSRPPVVYLRSFKDDAKVARRIGLAGFRVTTEEGELADLVHDVGPLVAIGRPGEELSYYGADRIYVGEGDWHERVSRILKRAPLVILRAGSTSGLWWEVEQCAKQVKPERLVVLIPLKQREYEEFCREAQPYFPCQFPPYAGRFFAATTLRSVLYFDEDWTPHLDPILKYGRMYHVLNKIGETEDVFTKEKSELRRVLEEVLEPVLKRVS